MNADIADRRRTQLFSDPTRSTYEADRPVPVHWAGSTRAHRKKALVLLLGLTAMLVLHAGEAGAQESGMLDPRVTQQSVGETICRPGYADTVAPPFSELMEYKDQLLAERGIDTEDGLAFALDRRVPIVLGGAPNAPANLDLLPWAGQQGERRKARAAVMLKRCVCEGKLSLAQAQNAIVGKWSEVYSGFSQTSCDVRRLDLVTGDNEQPADHDAAP
jgi:hypothetical protein